MRRNRAARWKSKSCLSIKKRTGPPWVRIRVLDWGAGISEENIQKLLGGRAVNLAGVDSHGSGLGVAIARKIAQLHGGQISIFSEETVGTCVEMDLPGSLPPSPRAHFDGAQKTTPSAH